MISYLMAGQETTRLMFRNIRPSDFITWLDFFKDPETFRHWLTEKEAPEIACKKWYSRQNYRYRNELGGMNALIEKHSGKLIGHCGLLVQKVDGITALEIGYSLLPEFWNRGYATEAARKCRDYAFAHDLSETLISIISLSNTASANVALKNGMKIDKRTIYKGNKVYIYSIKKQLWNVLLSTPKLSEDGG